MKIVVASPSVLQDGANARNTIGATLCNYMVAMRGFLPPNTKDGPLLNISGISGYQSIWLMAQVWDVDKEMLKDLRLSTAERGFNLGVLEEYSMMISRIQPDRPTDRAGGADAYTARAVQDTIYVVHRGLSSIESSVYDAGLPSISTGTAVVFPVLHRTGVTYMHRSYRPTTALNAMFSDVMERIHETLRGNET
jgi:hypothetical protein